MNRENYLIIYCHPNPESFTHAALERVAEGLRKAGRSFQVLDLYGRGFDPVLVVNSARRRRDLITDPETTEYRAMIEAYDNFVFVYPVWWGSFPAMLKGFIDRTFVSGLTYSYKNKPETSILPHGLMKGKRAYFVFTLDSPWPVALLDPGWLAIKIKIFKYCGFDRVRRLYLPGLKRQTAAVRARWLDRVGAYFSKL